MRLDAICLQPFSSKLQDSFVAVRRPAPFSARGEFLADSSPAAKPITSATARSFLSRYPTARPGLDNFRFPGRRRFEKPLQFLADFGHELVLLHLWSEEDREPPWEGELELKMPRPGSTRAGFRRRGPGAIHGGVRPHAKRLERLALRNSGRYVGLPTTVSIERAVFGRWSKAGPCSNACRSSI